VLHDNGKVFSINHEKRHYHTKGANVGKKRFLKIKQRNPAWLVILRSQKGRMHLKSPNPQRPVEPQCNTAGL
jgi:hypothetical protein